MKINNKYVCFKKNINKIYLLFYYNIRVDPLLGNGFLLSDGYRVAA